MDLFFFEFEPQVALSRQEHHLQEVPIFPPGERMGFDTGPVRGACQPCPPTHSYWREKTAQLWRFLTLMEAT